MPDPTPEEHIISYQDAENLIYSFITKYRNTAQSVAAGGFIDLKQIKDKALASYPGILFWYCWNESDSNHPPFFVAFERDNNFEQNNRPTSPISSELYRTNQLIRYNHSLSATGIKLFLQDDEISFVTPNGVINNSSTRDLSRKFMSDFPQASDGSRYNALENGFFYMGSIDLFLKQPIIGVNYYFGLNLRLNKLCLVMFGVGANKKNITGANSIILERAWP